MESEFETLWHAYLKRFSEPFSMYEEFISEDEAIRLMKECLDEDHPYRPEVDYDKDRCQTDDE